MEGGDEIEQGEDASFAQRVQDVVDVANGPLSEGADDVELLVVVRDICPKINPYEYKHDWNSSEKAKTQRPGTA